MKTCVGAKWCRFGTQDSTGLGVKLEQMTWGSWMPHKFKLAVSGCPRNCAEATIKDFGVVCVDSGYELHVGGNGGIKVRVTDLLVQGGTEEQVLEYCAAFTQLYREEAHYLERTAPWVERVGLAHIKARWWKTRQPPGAGRTLPDLPEDRAGGPLEGARRGRPDTNSSRSRWAE